MKAADVRTKMEELKRVIQTADHDVRAGKKVDLSGLDSKVALICTKAVALPPSDAMDIQPLMADLIGELEHLTQSLQDYRDTLKG